MRFSWARLLELLGKRPKPESDIGPYIRHGPTLTGEKYEGPPIEGDDR
jgi:hypothetical protein